MFLKQISIINYKNLSSISLELSPKLNCLIGNNGVGKTNFLDALYYLSFCRSASCINDSQLIRHDQDFFVIDGTYLMQERESQIYCGMKRGHKKTFKLDKKAYKRLSQHIGRIPLVLISPADTTLIDSASEERRKMMDLVISQYDHNYINALSHYNKALQQRNALLKMEQRADDQLMTIIEEEMDRHACIIYEARKSFIDKITPIFKRLYSQIAGENEPVEMRYHSHVAEHDLKALLMQGRPKEKILGHTIHGTHRDDIEMLLHGHPIRKEGSQGQAKSYVIALKLSLYETLREAFTDKTPLLLLDDIFDKLDAHRVQNIINIVSGKEFGQIFMTDTNRKYLDEILRHVAAEYKIFEVENGDFIERKE